MLDRRDFLQLVAAAAASACTPGISEPPRGPMSDPYPPDDGRHDFDFLFGRWTMTNQHLRTRLKADTRWDEFTSVSEVHPILGGLGNTDTYAAARFADGKPLQGATLRLFNPATGLWSIYWADDRRVTLDPPVIGRFERGVGTFIGDDVFEGKPIKFRFVWTAGAHPTWEQAFSADGGQTWETNFRNQFTRTA
jgi:hypothetical protein